MAHCIIFSCRTLNSSACTHIGSLHEQKKRIGGLVCQGSPQTPLMAVAFEVFRARYSQKTYMFVQGDASERFGLTAKEISSLPPQQVLQ